jgi:hypothetical protein
MSTQYRLVQSGNTASGGCSAGQGSSEPVAPRIADWSCNFVSIGKTKDEWKMSKNIFPLISVWPLHIAFLVIYLFILVFYMKAQKCDFFSTHHTQTSCFKQVF